MGPPVHERGFPVIEKVQPYWKAVVAFVAPAATLLTIAVTESSAGGEIITAAEWWAAGLACIITAAGVYATPNIPSSRPSEA